MYRVVLVNSTACALWHSFIETAEKRAGACQFTHSLPVGTRMQPCVPRQGISARCLVESLRADCALKRNLQCASVCGDTPGFPSKKAAADQKTAGGRKKVRSERICCFFVQKQKK